MTRGARESRELARRQFQSFYSSGALLRRVRASAPPPAPPSAPRGRVAMRDPAPGAYRPGAPPRASGSSPPGGVAPAARVSSETRYSAAVAADDDPSGPDDLAATAPLRAHYAFAGADDPALDDVEWLARALEAARSQGLVAEDRSTEAERMRLDLAHVDLDPARRDDDVHDDDDDDDWDWDPDPPGVPASGGGSSSESEPALFPSSASTPSHHPPARGSPGAGRPGPATASSSWTTTTATRTTSSTSSHWSTAPRPS